MSLRILWSIHLYPPSHNCGSEYVAHHVNKFLVSKGHQVRVILHQYNGKPFIYEGVEVFPANGRIDAYQWADVIFTHLDYTQFTWGMSMTCKRPLIHFVHNDIEYHCIKNGIRGQHIVYNSDWIRNKMGYEWPGYTLHPPCDTSYYNVNDDPASNKFITLISLNERKGGYMFKKIAEAMPDRQFMGVWGSYDNPGPMKLSQQQIVDMMPPNVTIVQNSPDILNVYRQTRLLLMPSDYESWGRTATEAMCNGIPVICTPTDGLLENCGEAGTYIGKQIPTATPGDACVTIGKVDDWVKAIKKFDDLKYYCGKSLFCRDRANQLNPQKELEGLEAFIYSARF